MWEHIGELAHTVDVLTKFYLGVTNKNLRKKHIKIFFSKTFLEKLINFNLSTTFLLFFFFFSYWIINSLNCLGLLEKVDWLWKELFYHPLWGHPLQVTAGAVSSAVESHRPMFRCISHFHTPHGYSHFISAISIKQRRWSKKLKALVVCKVFHAFQGCCTDWLQTQTDAASSFFPFQIFFFLFFFKKKR